MPVENFGLAILRGCGWKDGEGIGKNPKVTSLHSTQPLRFSCLQVVPLRILDRRPKGLGLGAKVPSETEQNGKSANGKEASEDDKQLKPGACVKVIQHRKYTGMYGKVGLFKYLIERIIVLQFPTEFSKRDPQIAPQKK